MANVLSRRDPFAGLTRWDGNIDRLFQDLWNNESTPEGRLLAPAIDVSENESRLTVTAELPGLDRKDIEVAVKDGVLTIRGEKRMEEESKDAKFHRVERRYGAFYRALSLPDSVDSEKVDATFRNGVLQVSLPKRPERKPKSIEVKE